jgi:hypothetical protein
MMRRNAHGPYVLRETSTPQNLTLGDIPDGTLVKRNGTMLVGGTAPGAVWSADVANPTPHADDEEFNGAWPATGWAEMDPTNLSVPTQGDGFLQLANLSNATPSIHGVYRAKPAGTEWSVWTKVQLVGNISNTQYGGIFIAESATAPTVSRFWAAGTEVFSASPSSNHATLNWATYNAGNAGIGAVPTITLGVSYMRVAYDGTSFFSYASADGVAWRQIHSLAAAFVPVHVGLWTYSLVAQGVTTYALFDFYRVKAGAGSSGVGAGIFRGGRV